MTNAEEILAMLAEQGKIDLSTVTEEAEMNKLEKEIKEIHKGPISRLSDGRWMTYVKLEGKRKKIVKTKYEDELHAIAEFYGIHKQVTLRSLYPEWIEHKKLKAARDTYPVRINSDWKRFYDKDDFIDIPIEELTPLECEAWMLTMIKSNNLTRTAYYNATIILREGLDYAVEKGIITENPCRKVHLGRRLFRRTPKKPDEEQVFTPEEVARFEQLAWEDFKDTGRKVYKLAPLAALFGLYTGARVGETTGFQISDIDRHDIIVSRFVEKDSHKIVDHAKTDAGTDRRIPLIKKAQDIISVCKNLKKECGSDSPWLFSEYDRPLPSRIVEEYYRKYCKAIETPTKTPHCARKTYISCLVDNGININTVRKYVGHADERTTYRNYVYDRSTPAEKMSQLEKALAYESVTKS